MTGRDEQIERFSTLADRLRAGRTDKNLLITGLRGVGKTVLLNTFADIGESKGFHASHIEITEGEDFPPVVARMLRRALLAISPGKRRKAHLTRALSVLKSFSIKIPGGPEIGLDVTQLSGVADSGHFPDDLAELFVVVGEAALDEGRGILLFFDEIHYLKRENLAAR